VLGGFLLGDEWHEHAHGDSTLPLPCTHTYFVPLEHLPWTSHHSHTSSRLLTMRSSRPCGHTVSLFMASSCRRAA